jgi:hypothetical protein
MRSLLLIVYFSLNLFVSIHAQSILFRSVNEYSTKEYAFPPTKIPINDFSVIGVENVLIPLNGGIYFPEDSIWFIPPKHSRYIISFALNQEDTSLFLLTRDSNYCSLYYIKAFVNRKMKSIDLLKLEKGLYNLSLNKNILYVWGYTSGNYKIGIWLQNEIKWLVNIKEKITAIDFDEEGNLLFSVGKAIINYNLKIPIAKFDTTILGFSYINKNKLIISSAIGIFSKDDNKYDFLGDGIQGATKNTEKCIFILSDMYPILIRLEKKKL